ncbi:MAG TPA: plasma-membrane proton-efflux P-type ATPase [Terriglobales bacterium]|nr:plasma-membrane proton-efflux P-type ATPase [Terriglobales bacterium]
MASDPPGLSTAEAEARLRQFGPNRVAEERRHPLRVLLGRFWAPVPWMLEATIALELVARHPPEAVVIAALLLFNAALGALQEGQAGRAVGLLQRRLAVGARVRRDGRWQPLAADQLVPGDVIHLRVGDLAPADVRLFEGTVQADESDLTGESLPVERAAGALVYAGSRLQRGEASGEVAATGARTYFGRTAELVKTAKTASHLEALILAIVRALVLVDGVLVAILLLYAGLVHLPWAQALPFALILLVASVPVALPATFTVATAVGAMEMARAAVLVTRLSAIEEAAAMDVLCTDKTGTLTQNRLAVGEVWAAAGQEPAAVLRLAALASEAATQDPLDLAILAAAAPAAGLRRLGFEPFDPANKRSEGRYATAGGSLRAVKGAPEVVMALAGGADPAAAAAVARMAARGARVLAVAADAGAGLQLAGLVALEDPLRPDSPALVAALRRLGVRVLMVTGDGEATARAVAAAVGLGPAAGPRVAPAASLRADAGAAEADHDVFAGVFPEDKLRLVERLQRAGHVVGMTGDGVNDAPALQRAEAGIAVASATDVAKAAASLVLTESGLGGVVRAVETGRRIYQRMLTYILNKIMKTLEIGVFVSVGVMLTGRFVITPLLIVLLLFTNDFVTMAIATDRVEFSSSPDRWQIGRLMRTAGALAALVLVFSFAVLGVGLRVLHLPLPQLQTLVFVMLVFTGQGNVYLVRERRRLWHSRPSRWLVASSVADVAVVGLLATRGILMAPLPAGLVGALLAAVGLYLLAMDAAKVRILRRLG